MLHSCCRHCAGARVPGRCSGHVPAKTVAGISIFSIFSIHSPPPPSLSRVRPGRGMVSWSHNKQTLRRRSCPRQSQVHWYQKWLWFFGFKWHIHPEKTMVCITHLSRAWTLLLGCWVRKYPQCGVWRWSGDWSMGMEGGWWQCSEPCRLQTACREKPMNTAGLQSLCYEHA